MEYEDYQSLDRIEDGEDVLESNFIRTKTREPEHPRDSKQGKNHCGGLNSSSQLGLSRLR